MKVLWSAASEQLMKYAGFDKETAQKESNITENGIQKGMARIIVYPGVENTLAELNVVATDWLWRL